MATTIYGEYIYAVIKNDEGQLTMKTFPVELSHEPTDKELCEFFQFSTHLEAAYCSVLYCLSPYDRRDRESLRYERDDRRLAFAYAETINHILQDDNVVAISHRQGGWKEFKWDFNGDISFRIASNFGYGNSSYLMSRFFYKGLQLTPYSKFVEYRYANYSDIMRYTYDYKVSYDSWIPMMNDAISFYNAVVEKKEHKIFEWLVNHLDKMVIGLNNIITAEEYYAFPPKYERIREDDLIRMKAEKVKGSIDFIRNIRELPAQVNPETYVEKMEVILNRYLSYSERSLSMLTDRIRNIDDELDVLAANPLMRIFDRLYRWHGSQEDWSAERNRPVMLKYLHSVCLRLKMSMTNERLLAAHNEYRELVGLRYNLQAKRSQSDDLLSFVESAVEKIHAYLGEHQVGEAA